MLGLQLNKDDSETLGPGKDIATPTGHSHPSATVYVF